MAKSPDWRNVLAPDLVQQIEDEMGRKFAEGWNAYERALQESMRQIAPPPEVRERRPAAQGGSTRGQARVPRGHWAGLILQVLESVEPERLSYTDLMTRVQARSQEHHLARSSFNVSLERLERDGKIGRDGNSWFLRVPSVGASSSDAGDEGGNPQLTALALEDGN